MLRTVLPLVLVGLVPIISAAQNEVFLGSLTTRAHDVSGDVYALSERVIEVRNFFYDGTGPAAFFWYDANPSPSRSGGILADGFPSESCGATRLPRATGETYRVEFPQDMSVADFAGGSFSVWCEVSLSRRQHKLVKYVVGCTSSLVWVVSSTRRPLPILAS